MDPEYSLQDVVRCHLCETPVPPLHCVLCKEHLCKDCEGKHLSNKYKEHKVVAFKDRRCFSKCQKHSTKICERYCEQCKIPICELCVSSSKHLDHELVDFLSSLQSKRHVLQTYILDLEKSIYPTYLDMASNISVQKKNMYKNYQKLKTDINKHRKYLHKEIDTLINKLKYDLDFINSKGHAFLDKQEGEILHTISEIKKNIADMKKLLDSNDISLVSTYKSRNTEFRRFPTVANVSLPTFTPKDIYQQVGSLTAGDDGVSISAEIQLIDEPLVIKDINTEYKQYQIRSISCPNDENIWISGDEIIIRLYSFQRSVIKSVQTKTENIPDDIAVTRNGDLVYTDHDDRTVNIVENGDIKMVVTFNSWRPRGVCSASSGDLLIILNSDDYKQTKVVRYSGSTEKQNIQYNDEGKPLYSSGDVYKYISENRNLDICVSDYEANSIVVVNQFGKLRFTFTGPPSTTQRFFPLCITTDSQSRILIADCGNKCVHILDQGGQFLKCIDNCHLDSPWGLCVDISDNLFVAEYNTSKVKKIKYQV